MALVFSSLGITEDKSVNCCKEWVFHVQKDLCHLIGSLQPDVSPTGRSVLLIGLGFVTLELFRSLQTLLNVEARTASSLVGEFRVDELTEEVVQIGRAHV